MKQKRDGKRRKKNDAISGEESKDKVEVENAQIKQR
jgi:hypothetical protein